MIKKNLWPFVIFILVVLGVFYFNFIKPRDVKNEVIINGHSIFVEVVDRPDLRAKGLSGRGRLNENEGMLFVFNKPGNYYFWMKNVKMPLDIIFMDENKKVAHLNKNAQPCQQKECPNISADQPVKYVLEINAGQAEKSNIKNGDQLVFKNFKYPL